MYITEAGTAAGAVASDFSSVSFGVWEAFAENGKPPARLEKARAAINRRQMSATALKTGMEPVGLWNVLFVIIFPQ